MILKFFSLVAIICLPAIAFAQESIDVDESTVHSDFNFFECRRQAKTLDQSAECTVRNMIYRKKFYKDGTLVTDDPNRGKRALQDYKDKIRQIFTCTNRGAEVLRIEALYIIQNKMTGEYTLISDDNEVHYKPLPGDLCQATPLN